MTSPDPLPSAPARRRRPVLWREISWIMLFKLAFLTLLWYLFFGPSQRVVVTPERVQQTLFAPGPAAPPAPGDKNHA